jgi:hypothetical protein
MKSTQKVTRVKLSVEPTSDFVLLGLVSAEPDYKLCLSINKKFRISLKNVSPLAFNRDKNTDLSFSKFSNIDEHPDLTFNLITNRSGKDYLLAKLKNIDYLLQIHEPDNEINIEKITSGLREIESVTAVFNIDINTIKDKNLHYLTH